MPSTRPAAPVATPDPAPARLDFSAIPMPPADRRGFAAPSIAPFTVAGLIGFWARRYDAPEGDPLGGTADDDPNSKNRERAGFIAGCAAQALPPTPGDGDHPSYMLATLAVARVGIEKISEAADELKRLTGELRERLDKMELAERRAAGDGQGPQLQSAVTEACLASWAAESLSTYAHALAQVLEGGPEQPV